jgi:putative DNA primase/helicase
MGVQIDDDFTGAPSPAQPTEHRGQVRMAYRLAANATDRLMFVHGLGWHVWDGTRWAEDQRGQAKREVIAVLRGALAESLDDKDLRVDVRRCESASGIGGVLDIAASLTAFAFTVRDLDPDPYLLNVANGTLDLRTMQLRDHEPADRITKITAAAWDPNSCGAVWKAFLARVLPEEEVRAFLRRYVGLSLTGAVLEHVLAILTGSGRNGKGVLYGAVNHALGDYAGIADPDLFMHRDHAHPTGQMDLRGLRWVVVSESDPGRRLAEATVKRLTGGDEIKARKMRQDFVAFRPSHTAALVTNHLPRVSGDDAALWARLRVIPFEVVIPREEQDPHLPDKLQLEADAILSWAITGWADYQRIGLAEPAGVVEATEDYHTASNAVRRFITDCCLVNPHAYVLVADLWSRWQQWRADDGAEEISKKALGEAFDKLGYPAHKGARGVRVRRGIGLLDDDDTAAPDAD